MSEFFRALRNSIKLAEDFEDFYRRNFCLDLDSGEPDLNASFYEIKQPESTDHPVKIMSEHAAHCLPAPIRKGYGISLPIDAPYKHDPAKRIFSFSGSAHCELQATDDASLRKIAQVVYARGKNDYFVSRNEILQYVDKRESQGDIEWINLLNSRRKKGWRTDLEKWRKKKNKKKKAEESSSVLTKMPVMGN